MILTQQKNVPWRWVFLIVSPWFASMYIEMCTGAILTLSLRKFLSNPATITFILSLNVLFNVIIGAVCLYASDRVWTRFGRRKPFLMLGYIPLIVVLLFTPAASTVYVLVPLAIIWLAFQDIGSTNEPLQQEVVPPHQRGRAGAIFNVIIQMVSIFLFVIVAGRFNELQYIGRRVVNGEQAVYWLGALFLFAVISLLFFFVKELPVKNSLAGEKMSPVRFFKSVFMEKNLWPVYLLIFAQTFISTQVGPIATLLYVQQWGYSMQEMGTNMFVGALITILISAVAGYFADKVDRIKLYIFGISGALVVNIAFYLFVQFILPDRRPSLLQLVVFGNLGAVFGMLAGVVTQPLMYDFIPRDKMGTASAGISYVRSLTRWVTLNGAGVFVVLYSKAFCEKGTYDYLSSYIYIIVLCIVGLIIILNFQRLVKKGVLIPYGRVGVEDDAPSGEGAVAEGGEA